MKANKLLGVALIAVSIWGLFGDKIMAKVSEIKTNLDKNEEES